MHGFDDTLERHVGNLGGQRRLAGTAVYSPIHIFARIAAQVLKSVAACTGLVMPLSLVDSILESEPNKRYQLRRVHTNARPNNIDTGSRSSMLYLTTLLSKLMYTYQACIAAEMVGLELLTFLTVLLSELLRIN